MDMQQVWPNLHRHLVWANLSLVLELLFLETNTVVSLTNLNLLRSVFFSNLLVEVGAVLRGMPDLICFIGVLSSEVVTD